MDQNSPLLQVGIGGIFAIQIIRMILEFLVKHRPHRNGNGKSFVSAGEKPVEFWQMEHGEIVKEALVPVVDILERQTTILEQIQKTQSDLVHKLSRVVIESRNLQQ